MSWIQTRRRAQEAPAGRPMEDTLRRQMAWAAGTEQFQHRDPLYHVTESFQQTFDAIGRRHARQLAGGRTEEGAEERADQTSGENQMPDQTSARSFYERSRPEDQDMVRRFSETAFQRGTLSGAVLEGTGQMMLFSCLKKTVGQSQPDKWQQRKLFEKASPMRNVPGHSPDKVVFNRGFTHSAVGLVVDTLRDARRTVEDMQDLALGRSEMGQDGADTLRTMYPFLDDSREQELLEQYRRQLREAGDGREKAALQNAAARMEALIAKKAQMKQELGPMEQQSQARERQREQPQDRRAEENRRTPERERLSDAGLAARAVLAGESLLDLPPSRLEELAGWVGNQGMAELLELQAGPVEETSFRMPEGELETEPFPVPESPVPLLDAPQGLTAQESPGPAFDPANLQG